MMRNLLVQRFKLAAHVEDEEVPGYALLVAKNGHRMKATPQPAPRDGATVPQPEGVDRQTIPDPIRFRLVGHSATMNNLVRALSDNLGQPVSDNTGLDGKYDFTVTFLPVGFAPKAAPMDASDPMPDLFAALSSQIGLRLEPRKQRVPVVVVVHAERTPTEN